MLVMTEGSPSRQGSAILHFPMYSSSQRRGSSYSSASFALLTSVAVLCGAPSESHAADLLVADRLSNSVYRYSQSGALLGTVVDHSSDLNQPTGIGMSPDFKELYVSSSQNNRLMKYDYNSTTGVASNPTIFADASDGLAFPNDIQFSPDASKIYVGNLSGGVSRFNLDGSSAGSKLMLPTSAVGVDTPTSSLNFTNDGKLLAGAFQDASGVGGGIAISNPDVSAFPGYLVQPTSAINGATGLMIHDGYLYVAGLFALPVNIRRFALSNGQMDESFGIAGGGFPQDLAESPNGREFFAGILGFANGSGKIARYSYDGALLGTFAAPSEGGFTEATAFTFVPTSSVIGDFNNDGRVNSADYVVWRKASPTATLPNDDTPGVVDASDYADWRANLGAFGLVSSPGLGTSTVPEPASALLLFIAMLAASMVRNRT
jgi:hypothetical protein